MRHLTAFNMRISQLCLFICFIFLFTLLQQVLFRLRDNPENQIIISTYK